MASENETVAEICSKLKEIANGQNVSNDGLVVEISQDEIWDACERIEAAHKREVAELRECLKEAVVYFCGSDKQADCTEKVYGNPKCETEGEDCVVERWRKTLEGENNGK